MATTPNLFEQFQRGLQNLIPAAVGGLSIIPGPLGSLARDFSSSPAGQSFSRQAEGQRLTGILSERRPDYTRAGSRPAARFAGPGGLRLEASPEGVGRQAISERTAAFGQQQELASSQRSVVDGFRKAMRGNVARTANLLAEAERDKAAGLETVSQAIRSTLQTKQQVGSLLTSAARVSANLLNELRGNIGTIRADFADDIASRATALQDGIRAATDSNFNEHIRAVEGAGGPITSEERAALRAVYDRHAATQTSTAVGSLHEATAEYRASLDANLNSQFAAAASTAVSNVATLGATAASTFANADRISADLTVHANDFRRLMTATRQELVSVLHTMTLDGDRTLFDMVSATVHPVAVYSDILSGVLDFSFDVLQYNNDLSTQELLNEIGIQNPLHQSIFDAINGFERGSQFDRQIEQQEDASRNSLIGSGIQAAGSVAGGYLSRDR